MAIHAFKDKHDGYYQCEVADGEPLPAWTENLTPTEVIVPVISNEDKIVAIEAKYATKRAALSQDMIRTLLANGNNMDTIIANVRGKYAQLSQAEADEIDATFS